MICASTPLTHDRAAMVQDLFQLVFCRQLEASHDGNLQHSSPCAPLNDQALADVVHELAAVLEQTDRREDADLLLSLVDLPLASASLS